MSSAWCKGWAGAIPACLCMVLFSTFSLPLYSQQANNQPAELAPGWKEPEFEPPAAGTYSLPPLGKAGDGKVLDSSGDSINLHELMGDKLVVLSFIYSSCSDVNGCPLATHVLERVQDQLLESPDGFADVRFVSLSFDPIQDTPEVMARYGRAYKSENFDWWFLTTGGQEELEPILESYGQTVIRDPQSEEAEIGGISHVLKVFLVDRDLKIRNIFGASFLHTETMLNDIRTLRMEYAGRYSLQGPGDVRDGYEHTEYRTEARSLVKRQGETANLRAYVDEVPLGLPPIPIPEESSITQEKIELGRLLFFDRRLSHNKTFSCAMCHIPEQGFSSNELATAVGIEGRTVRRNSPTIYNVAYLERLFHDGRESTLEQQIWGPLLARNEMGNPSVGRVIELVQAVPDYVSRFESAFEGRSISMETIGMALASYQRVLVSANSPFDRWYFEKEEQALSEDQQAGFRLFTGKAGCSSCHLIETSWALFTDNRMHNTGIGYERSMLKPENKRSIQIAPGKQLMVMNDAVSEAAEPVQSDLGLYEITENPDDRWKYRTPSLRNVELTAPYMHDGSISTLEEVIAFYDRGGVPNKLLDPLIQPLGLSETEADQLLKFLRALTGDNVDTLVADAIATPVGNTGAD